MVALLQLAKIWSNYHIWFPGLLMVIIITISVTWLPSQENPSPLYPALHMHV
jgi:hypothetical protein